MDRNLLEHLSGLAGIETAYWDIWGNEHRISDGCLEKMLHASGISFTDEESARAEVERLQNRWWTRALPPVAVFRESEQPAVIELHLDRSAAGREFAWMLVEENGRLRSGTFTPVPAEGGDERKIEDRTLVRCSFTLPHRLPAGYHDLQVREWNTRLIVAPDRCYTAPAVEGGKRVWGLAVQLYALRSERNWGIGDFTDLRALVDLCAPAGAGFIGLSPLHALFPERPDDASPYCPSSRCFRNVLFLDVEAIPEFKDSPEARELVASTRFQQGLAGLRSVETVDYAGVAAAKMPVLEILYRHFRLTHLEPDSPRGREYGGYLREGGDRLRAFGTFEEERLGTGAGYHVWLQWQVDRQMEDLCRHAREAGLSLGIYQDLAVGVDGGGFDAGYQGDLYARGASVGAPPDDFNLNGQDWGLPPYRPDRLRDAAYEPFIATLRACMRHADVLRIDHVMGLMRLFWVLPGRLPSEGAYMRYPAEDLFAVVALESVRNRCMVIGEDLGTVPDEVRETMHRTGMLSCQILYFSKDHQDRFRNPADFPDQALAAVTTHDLPTLAGYWMGTDIEVRTGLELFPSEEFRRRQIERRELDRRLLLEALEGEGLLPGGTDAEEGSLPPMLHPLATAVHRYLARCRSSLFSIQLEDILGQVEQVNLPGTVHRYPNWRRKLPATLEEIAADRRFTGLAEEVSRERAS